ncbi:MAG: TonB C-terminal domain-containing protein [Deltaproteobacteria bacterium]|nr:TonB C-terminal domain-containing protein [Deltaproteobacteria bacterium]
MDGKLKDDPRGLMEMQWKPMAILSVLFHVAVFASILFIPESLPAGRSFDGMVYEVNLVEMPRGGGGVPESGGVPIREAHRAVKKEAAAKQVPVEPAKRITQAPKREEKPVIIAKKTLDKPLPAPEKPKVAPSELIDKAISKIERNVKSEEHLDTALAKLESRALEIDKDAGPSPSGGGLVGGGPNYGGGIAGGTAIQIYRMQVDSLIKSNWHYPVATDNQKEREAILLLTVKRDGAIISTRFEKKSQNVLFDESVLKAIERSNPLPPFPGSYRRSHEELIINFNLRELERN